MLETYIQLKMSKWIPTRESAQIGLRKIQFF